MFGPSNGKIVVERFNEAEEIASLDINFLGGFIEGVSIGDFYTVVFGCGES